MDVSPAPLALLDTSVVIDLPADLHKLAVRATVSTITLAELAAGLSGADPLEDVSRTLHYQWVLDELAPIAFSATAARLYGGLYKTMQQAGRNPRGRRFDLLIAAVAVELDLPVITRNARDFEGIHPSLLVVAVPPT